MSAFNSMADAFNDQRKQWYGYLWEAVDWYGIADRLLPENQRQDIMRYLGSNDNE